jgi:hypothetical protein
MANLLTIPREIRNIIYSCLHHPVQVCSYQSLRTANLKLHNAPLVGVLQTHPQIYEEYQTADCFKNLSCVLTCRPVPAIASFADIIRKTSTVDSKSFSHISHVELRSPVYLTLSCILNLIPRELHSMFSNFKTLRFIEKVMPKCMTTDELCENPTKFESAPPPMPPPHQSLFGLELNQVAKGYNFSWDPDDEYTHQPQVFRFYLYANANASASKEKFWTLAEASDRLIKVDYPEEVLESLEEKRQGITAFLSPKVVGWEDQRMV